MDSAFDYQKLIETDSETTIENTLSSPAPETTPASTPSSSHKRSSPSNTGNDSRSPANTGNKRSSPAASCASLTPEASLEVSSGYLSGGLATATMNTTFEEEEVLMCLQRNQKIVDGAIRSTVECLQKGEDPNAVKMIDAVLSVLQLSGVGKDERTITQINILKGLRNTILKPSEASKSHTSLKRSNSETEEKECASSSKIQKVDGMGSLRENRSVESIDMPTCSLEKKYWSPARYLNSSFMDVSLDASKIGPINPFLSTSTSKKSTDATKEYQEVRTSTLGSVQSAKNLPAPIAGLPTNFLAGLPTQISGGGSSNTNPFLQSGTSSNNRDSSFQHSGCHVHSTIASNGQSVTAHNATGCCVQTNAAFGCGNVFLPK